MKVPLYYKEKSLIKYNVTDPGKPIDFITLYDYRSHVRVNFEAGMRKHIYLNKIFLYLKTLLFNIILEIDM